MKQSKHGDAASAGEKLPQPIDAGVHVKVENHQVEVIDLSDDEIDDAAIATSHQTSADHDSSIWYCISPQGNTKGPYSMQLLKQWSASSRSHCELHFKVYKSGQRPEEALLLVDAFRHNFN
ncbi:zinc finger CCCH domain-containing protein 44-like [Hibiscus syriacus]|nr:zinc finger CCCH domain-containing protein 44-like [Hibiscus syriacus]